jgi:hypothetical protein
MFVTERGGREEGNPHLMKRIDEQETTFHLF